MPNDARIDAAPKLREFRDTRPGVQYVLGGIAGAGIVGVVTLLRRADGVALPLILAGALGVLTLTAMAIVYLKFGYPVALRQMEFGIERICGDEVYAIPYDDLYGLRAKWTDVQRNGIYNHTQVRLEMCSQTSHASDLTYESTVDYNTLKYNQLQEFQAEVAEIVAQQMSIIMQSEGHVVWTEKLSLRPDGLEMTRQAGGEAELIAFDRISQWKLEQGLFKLALDGSRCPVLAEDTGQWNFYPGLLLFSQLCQSPSNDASIDEREPALIG